MFICKILCIMFKTGFGFKDACRFYLFHLSCFYCQGVFFNCFLITWSHCTCYFLFTLYLYTVLFYQETTNSGSFRYSSVQVETPKQDIICSIQQQSLCLYFSSTQVPASSSSEKDCDLLPSLTKAIIPCSFSKWMHIIWLLSHWPALHTPFHKIHFVAHFSYSFTIYSRRLSKSILFHGKELNSYFYWLTNDISPYF